MDQKFDYVEVRLQPAIAWYDKKSQLNKLLFLGISVFEIVLTAGLPFLSFVQSEYKMSLSLPIGLIGFALTILSGILFLGKFQEKWITYRRQAEILKTELYFFQTRTQHYKGEGHTDTLVRTIETIIRDEVRRSLGQYTQQKK